MKNVSWCHLYDNWIKLSCDGTYNSSTCMAECRGNLFRDFSRNWIKRYEKKKKNSMSYYHYWNVDYVACDGGRLTRENYNLRGPE